MILNYREFTPDRYIIKSKIYLPEDENVKAVILGIHGFAGDKESSALSLLAEEGCKKGMALVTFDLPGHGQSPVEADQLTIKNCLADIAFMAEFCEKEYPGAKKRVFATSFGGFLALLSADILKEWKFVLRAPAVTMPEHILMDLISLTEEEYRAKGVVEVGFDRIMQLPYSFYEELKTYSVFEKSFEKDMLLVHGDQDDVVPHEDILDFCEKNPTMDLKVISGCDHRFKKTGELEQTIQWAMEFWEK